MKNNAKIYSCQSRFHPHIHVALNNSDYKSLTSYEYKNISASQAKSKNQFLIIFQVQSNNSPFTTWQLSQNQKSKRTAERLQKLKVVQGATPMGTGVSIRPILWCGAHWQHSSIDYPSVMGQPRDLILKQQFSVSSLNKKFTGACQMAC